MRSKKIPIASPEAVCRETENSWASTLQIWKCPEQRIRALVGFVERRSRGFFKVSPRLLSSFFIELAVPRFSLSQTYLTYLFISTLSIRNYGYLWVLYLFLIFKKLGRYHYRKKSTRSLLCIYRVSARHFLSWNWSPFLWVRKESTVCVVTSIRLLNTLSGESWERKNESKTRRSEQNR